ncbi:MAG: T9SS type A sorting domain-containing protein [Bacteroidia bacterium]|nr:T9SS type A sorting domain-containing protein [Bacteroidia bacterium]
MKRTPVYLLSLLLFCIKSQIQAQSFEWAVSFGNTQYEVPQGIDVDTAGNVYSTGFFYSSMDADPGAGVFNLVSNGGQDAYIQKLNAAGQFVWAKSIGGGSSDIPYDIAVSKSGEVYVTGRFGGTVDFDPGPGTFNLTSPTGASPFLLKLDASGNFAWAAAFSSTTIPGYGWELALDPSGNPLMAAQGGGTIDFDPGTGTQNSTTTGSNNLLLAKLTSSGAYAWHKVIQGTTYILPRALDYDQAGNVLVGGYYNGAPDVDPGNGTFNLSNSGTSYAGFVLKLNASGDFVWARDFWTATGNMYPNGIKTDPWNNMTVVGTFADTVDFDPGSGTAIHLTSGGDEDFFVMSLTSGGDFRWSNTCGGTIAEDVAYNVTVDNQGNSYTTGYFIGTVDFDPGQGVFNLASQPSALIGSAFVQKVDSAGNFVWAGGLSGNNASLDGRAIGLGKGKSIHITGQFKGTVDFDPGAGVQNKTATSGSVPYDAYVLKLSQCPPQAPTTYITGSACDFYFLNGQFYTATGTYTQTLSTSEGCDSILSLNLTVNQPTTSSLTVAACNSYNLNGTTYSSSGTFTQTLTNAAGCDSTLTLNLTIDQLDNSVTVNGSTLTANQSNAQYQWLDCDNNYSPVSGATAQSFSPIVSGNYAASLTAGSCTDTSACMAVTVVGLSSLEDEFLSVYPNPSTGIFVVRTNLIIEQIRVLDLLGEEISRPQGRFIDLQNYPAGMYFLDFQTERGRKVLRVVKEN